MNKAALIGVTALVVGGVSAALGYVAGNNPAAVIAAETELIQADQIAGDEKIEAVVRN